MGEATNQGRKVTARDILILRALARYYLLGKSQLKSLVFPDHQGLSSAGKYLRRLEEKGLVVRLKGKGETGYLLSQAGRTLLGQNGKEAFVLLRPKDLPLMQAITTVRLQLEADLNCHPVIGLQRFVVRFEQKRSQKGGNHQAFCLSDQVTHPSTGQEMEVFPDALMIFRHKSEGAQEQRLGFLVFDRGRKQDTFLEMVSSYRLYSESGKYRKYGRFDSFRVFLIVRSLRRADQIIRLLSHLKGSHLFRITTLEEIHDGSLTFDPIWRDAEKKTHRLVRKGPLK